MAVTELTVAAALDPVLAAVAQALQDAKRTGSVPLSAATLGTPGAGVVALFQRELATPVVTLTGAASITPDPDRDALVVAGTAIGTLAGLSGPSLTATFTTVADPAHAGARLLQVVLALDCGSGWRLATSFPLLAARTSLGRLTLDGGARPQLVLRSADGPADFYGPRQRAGLNLVAGIVADGAGPLPALDAVTKLPAGAKLALEGPASVGAAGESLALRGDATGARPLHVPVTGLSVLDLTAPQLVLRGAATPADDGTVATAVGVSAYGTASVGGAPVPLGVGLPTGLGPWTLFAVPDAGVTLDRLVGFVPGLSLLSIVPDALKDVVQAEIEQFALTLTPQRGGGWSLAGLQLAVRSMSAWTVIPSVLTLTSVRVTAAATWPGPELSGSVGGTVALAPDSGHPIPVGVTVPLPLGQGEIVLTSSPNVELPGLGALTTLVGGTSLTAQLPAGMEKLGSFELNTLTVRIDPNRPAITSASISLTTNESWTVVPGNPPWLALDALSLDLTATLQRDGVAVTGAITGVFEIKGVDVVVAAQRGAPTAHWELLIEADAIELPSIDDIAHLAGGQDLTPYLPREIADHHFVISTLQLTVDLTAGRMERILLVVSSGDPWEIVPGHFELRELVATLLLDWTSGQLVPSGGVIAALVFEEEVQLGLSAQRDPDATWTLRGELEQPVDVVALVDKAMGVTVPNEIAGAITIETLSLEYVTPAGSYAFAAAASWTPKLGDIQLELGAGVRLERHPDPAPARRGQFLYSGEVSGDLRAHFGSDQLELSLGYLFGSGDRTSYVFRLRFNRIGLTATYARAANGDAIAKARLTGVTFGDVVVFLVDLVDPSLHFSLPAPWDVLNKIRFDDLALVLNLTQRTVGIEYDVNSDLGIVDVRTISLTFLHKGGSPTVEIAMTGSFLGEQYPEERPLSWDLLNESPPATPGAGAALLDLQDLGVGQHLVLADPRATTMARVLEDLHEVIVPAARSPRPWELLHFDPKAGWLLGARFTVMGTVTLGLVFDDPVLYGLEVSLSGEKAGIFAGLDFEILYRKVSADVGVYHIALRLPDAMRHLEFGEVSITLPVVVLDIYTDGGFHIDLGFPHDNDWTVCFGVQVFPFVGAGGFYVGRLTAADGAGPSLVPAISNGTFGPVVDFGLALALGVGKEISAGPLKAGMSLTVQGVLQGVVAWFEPSDHALASDRYYKVAGTVAIVGKVYGSVDFKVVSVSVAIVASVSASLTVESYRPIEIVLAVDVSVQASVKVLFIRIHFSFSLHLSTSFTIGSVQPTPWQLADGAGSGSGHGRTAALAARRRGEDGHRALAAARTHQLLMAAAAAPLSWAPVQVLATVAPLDVALAPVVTVAPPSGGGASVPAIVLTPSISTAAPATAEQRARPRLLEAPVSRSSFDLLAEALLKWGMQTLIGRHAGSLTAVDLQLIGEDLADPATAAGGFAYDNVAAFLAANVRFAVQAPTAPSGGDEQPGAVVPMPPSLSMSAGGRTTSFWQAPQVDAAYQQAIREIFAQLAVNYDYDRAQDPLAGPGAGAAAAPVAGDGAEPITAALFADWTLMVARSVVQSAGEALQGWLHTPQPADSPISLARAAAPTVAYTVRDGDTAAAVAALFAIGGDALEQANPGVDFGALRAGTVLQVPPPAAVADYVTVPGDTLDVVAAAWGVTTSSLAADNPGVDFSVPGSAVRIAVPEALFAFLRANLDRPLLAGSVPIAGLRSAVRAGDTLQGIAVARFGQADPIALAQANAASPALLRADGTAALQLASASGGAIPYLVAADDTPLRVAGWLLSRDAGVVEDPALGWFAGAIAAANPGVALAGALAPGTPLTVPVAQQTDKGIEQTGTQSYVTKAGDTLTLVSGLFTLVELHADELAPIAARVPPLNPGATVQLPAVAHVIQPGDTLAGLAARFGLAVSDLATRNATAAVLTPNAPVALPPSLHVPVAAGTTPAQLAAALGLDADALAGRIGSRAGLFDPAQPLTLPDRRELDVDELVLDLVARGATADAAGMASHFMLHGLRLPLPPDPHSRQHAALSVLTGQQVTAPQPFPQTWQAAFSVGSGAPAAPWLTPVVWYAPRAGEALAEIAQSHGVTVEQIEALNPGLNPASLPARLRIPQPSATVALDQATFAAQTPATTLDPALTGAPRRVALVHAAPVAHSTAPPVAWTAAAPPQLPGRAAATASPSLLRLPSSLLTRVASDPGHPYELATSPKGAQLDDPPEVASYAWATWLNLTVRRLPAPGGGWLDGTYLVRGVDQGDRDALLGLWRHLRDSGDTVALSLARPGAAGGLVSDALDPAATAVLKADLSTETRSGPQTLAARAAELVRTALAAAPPATASYATLAAPAALLELLWEASVTGSGGFYLTYAPTGGGELPSSAFASGDDAQLQLIALLGSQTAAQPDRTLHPFTTGAVAGERIDASAFDVFARATDGSDTTAVTTAPPGNVAFEVARRNPVHDEDPDPSAQTRTQSLFSLLSFALSGSGFTPPPLALPLGATTTPPQPGDGPADGSVWYYHATVPVFRLADAQRPDLAPGLPPGAEDPYTGIADGAAVDLALAFLDVFGNEMPAGTPVPAIDDVPVAYYDPVRGLAVWPGASGTYALGGADGAARLTAAVDLAVARYAPSAANPFANAVRTAAADRAAYAQIHYQLSQPRVQCSLATSLDAPGRALLDGPAVGRPLAGFALAAYAFLGAAQAVEQVEHTVGQSPAETLATVATLATATVEELLQANAAADVSRLLSGSLEIPVQVVAAAGATLDSLAAAGGVTVAELLSANEQVPLAAGAALATAAATWTTRSGDTLTSLAALLDTTIAALAVANEGNGGVLAAQQPVTVGGVTVTTGSNDTFGTLVSAFAARGVTTTVAAIAAANANAPLLRAETPIAVAAAPTAPGDRTGARSHVVADGDTLDRIAAALRCTVAGIAVASAQTTGLLQPGRAVEVQGVTLTVGRDGTLTGLAEQLLASGRPGSVAAVAAALAPRDDVLATGASVTVVDYVVQERDALATVLAYSSAFDLARIALLNGPAQGLFPVGSALTVGSVTYQPQAGDTFDAIAAAHGVALATLAAAAAPAPLRPGAELALPGAVALGAATEATVQVPITTPPAATPTLETLAAVFPVDVRALGTLNATMPGLIAPGVTIRYPDHAPIETAAGATLASLAAQVGAPDVATFAATPAVAQLAGLVAPGALLIAAGATPAGRSLNALASALGVDPGDLAGANAALAGLPRAGHAITVRGHSVTAGDGDTLGALVRRLQAADATIELTDLVAAAGDDAGLLTPTAGLLVPPARVRIEAPLSDPRVGTPFAPLEASLTIARDATLVDPQARDIPDVVSSTSPLAADLAAGLPAFCAGFEQAFASRRLKLAAGPRPDGAPPRLWVADFGADGIASVALDGSAPRFYALAPVSRELAGGTVPVQSYDPATGRLGDPVERTFSAVDLDAWLRSALEAVDLVLSPATAAPAWRLDRTAFDLLVGAKQTIAGALRERVAEILDAGPPSDAGLAAAQETLYQSMLTSLSTAYTTDAIVQFPVTVSSPFGSGVTTGTADGFAQLASAYGVSPEAVAEALADAAGVLRVGAAVAYGGRRATTGADTTLAVLASGFGVAVTALPGGLSVTDGGGLFAPTTALPYAPLQHTVAAGDSFDALARLCATTPGAVGVATQDVRGLLAAGRTVALGRSSYVVQPGDTLRRVAAQLNSDAVTVAGDPRIAPDPTLLAAGVPVRCFSPLDPIPPRLSGALVADRFQAVAGDGVPQLLAWFGVSVPVLADALADTQELLAPGTVVSYDGSPDYAIAAGDTLRSLLAPLRAPSVAALLGGIAVVSGVGLLRPGATLAIARIARAPVAADSFSTLADYFATDPATVAVANEDRGGVFVPGVVLRLADGGSYTVRGPESIAQVAAALSTTPAGLATDALLVTRAGIFAATALHGIQPQPALSLSTAKLPLSAGTQQLSTLFGTSADTSWKSLFLDLSYAVSEVEFQIETVPGARGYQASEWLQFGVPLGDDALGGAVQLHAGQTDVPIPLRAYPQLPLVTELEAAAGTADPQTITAAKQWKLEAGVQHAAAAQDEMSLEVVFGGASAGQLRAQAVDPALFAALAQFSAVWPQLQHDAAALGELAPGSDDPRLTAVVGTFATIVNGIATALAARRPHAELLADDDAARYVFRLDPTYDLDGPVPHLATVDLTAVSASDAQIPWPQIVVEGHGDDRPLRSDAPAPGAQPSKRYYYPEGEVPAFVALEQRYAFPGEPVDGPGNQPLYRDAVRWQNGATSASVRRNASLVTTAPTADAFVYTTPWVSFANAAIPLLTATVSRPIGSGLDLGAPLRAALTELLSVSGTVQPGSHRLRLLCRYERQLVPSADGTAPLVQLLPVFYVPLVTVTGTGDIGALAASAAAQASAWLTAQSLVPAPGDAWSLEVSLFAGDDAQLARPLVDLSGLRVELG